MAAWRDEIQSLADKLSQDAGLEASNYRLNEYDFSAFDELPNGDTQ